MRAWACPGGQFEWGIYPSPSIDPPPVLPYIRASDFHRPDHRARPYEKLLRMANTPGSKKAVRKIARRTEINTARRSRVRTYLRKFDEALTGGDATVAMDAFVKAQSELMRAVSKGVVHKNTGSRKVSRLAAQLRKMSAA
jgi:small subunit ribosomal protein S20